MHLPTYACTSRPDILLIHASPGLPVLSRPRCIRVPWSPRQLGGSYFLPVCPTTKLVNPSPVLDLRPASQPTDIVLVLAPPSSTTTKLLAVPDRPASMQSRSTTAAGGHRAPAIHHLPLLVPCPLNSNGVFLLNRVSLCKPSPRVILLSELSSIYRHYQRGCDFYGFVAIRSRPWFYVLRFQ